MQDKQDTKEIQAPRPSQKKTRKADFYLKIPIWPTGHQPERQKEKGSRHDKTVTSVTLTLVKPNWPGNVLPTDVLLNSENKHMREGEWRLTAAGNHEKLNTPSRNAAILSSNVKKSCIMNPSTWGLVFPRNFLWMALPKGTNIQYLNSMTTLLSLQQDIFICSIKNPWIFNRLLGRVGALLLL